MIERQKKGTKIIKVEIRVHKEVRALIGGRKSYSPNKKH